MGTALILLVICFAASTVGAVVGAGGGVIIKPLLDFSGLMPAATASFCSGCTVLAMSTCSSAFTDARTVVLAAIQEG